MQFRLRTLLIVVAVSSVGLAVWKHYGEPRMRRQALIRECESPQFSFAFENEFTHSDGNRYRVLVFNSVWKSWPGHNPYKIVVANKHYKQRTSGVFGGEDSSARFRAAALTGRSLFVMLLQNS